MRQSKSFILWTGTGILAVLLGYGIATRPEETVIMALIATIAYVFTARPVLGLITCLFLPVIGELYRLPIGGDQGTLLSDVVVPVFAATWIAKKWVNQKRWPASKFIRPLLFFVAVAVASLIQALLFLTPSEVISGSMYLIRLVSYVMLGIITLDTLKSGHPQHTKKSSEDKTQILIKATMTASILIAVAGFIQLVVYPDLTKLEALGWDPHINRLVSTWLDPNFIGGLLVFAASILIGLALSVKKLSHKLGLAFLIALLTAALFLTYSRSAYVAMGVAILIIGLFKSRKLLIASILIAVIGIGVSPRAEQRVTDLVQSAASLVSNTGENPDATARLRIQSWEQTIGLITKRPLLGSGYNTLRSVNYNEGFVSNTDIHSASGSDSSLLTILATTGILGLIPFLWLYLQIPILSFKNWRNKKLPSEYRGYGLGVFAGFTGLFVHAFFVNSLLFPHLLIYLWIQAGILEHLNQTKPLVV